MTFFNFSRPVRLFESWPQSAAGHQLNPQTLDDVVRLVHPAAGPGARLMEAGVFSIQGAVGVAQVFSSVVPANRIVYYSAADAFHNDAVNQTVGFVVTSPNGTNGCFIQTPTLIGPVGGAATIHALNRVYAVPPGHTLSALAGAMGAGAQLTLRGAVVVMNLSDVPPPAF